MITHNIVSYFFFSRVPWYKYKRTRSKNIERLKWDLESPEFISTHRWAHTRTQTFSSYRRFIFLFLLLFFSLEPNRLSFNQFSLFIIWTTINFSRTINSPCLTRYKIISLFTAYSIICITIFACLVIF